MVNLERLRKNDLAFEMYEKLCNTSTIKDLEDRFRNLRSELVDQSSGTSFDEIFIKYLSINSLGVGKSD